MSKYSKNSQSFIGKKIGKLKDEGMEQKQAIAVAMDYARKEGYKVPSKRFSKLKKKMSKKD